MVKVDLNHPSLTPIYIPSCMFLLDVAGRLERNLSICLIFYFVDPDEKPGIERDERKMRTGNLCMTPKQKKTQKK